MKKVVKHLLPNAGTLILVGLFFLAQSAGALPGSATAEPLAPSQTLVSYQGTLTDPDGNPITAPVTMQFALYDAPADGSLLWGPETQVVQVDDGLFHVLLGSVVPIAATSLTGDLYLDISVNGERLSPRELLTSAVYAVEAGTLSAGAITRGNLVVDGSLSTQGTSGSLRIRANPDGGDFNIYHTEEGTKELSIFGSGTTANMNVELYDGNLDMNGNDVVDVSAVSNRGNIIYPAAGTAPSVRLVSQTNVMAFIDSDNDSTTQAFVVYRDNGSVTPPVSPIFHVAESGTITAYGQLNMNGHTVTNCGALTEANLQTEAELSAGRIDRFEEGDVLCWSAHAQRLEKCAAAGDPFVQAVADKDGRPIVIGAELVKVVGPVRAGDYLVASGVPGYAMAAPRPTFGIVIAQALEDFDGEQGIIKAMIRKM